jgi:quinol-cytochrome oxidoreductase complex cytochrome b subunit
MKAIKAHLNWSFVVFAFLSTAIFFILMPTGDQTQANNYLNVAAWLWISSLLIASFLVLRAKKRSPAFLLLYFVGGLGLFMPILLQNRNTGVNIEPQTANP